MIKIDINEYRDILDIPRIDNKQIVYTLTFLNPGWGKADFLDLKNNNNYEGHFYLVKENESSEILIHFILNGGVGFFSENPNIEGNEEQVLGLDDFINVFTEPYSSL